MHPLGTGAINCLLITEMLSSLNHVYEFCSKDTGFSLDPGFDRRGGLACPDDFEAATAKDGAGNTLGLCFRNLGPVGKDVPWTYCSAMCSSLGVNATLPLLHHEAEIKFAAQVARDSRASSIWLGLSDIETEGEWRWIDGKSANQTEVSWDGSFPKDKPGWLHQKSCGRDCGRMSSVDGTFTTAQCGAELV